MIKKLMDNSIEFIRNYDNHGDAVHYADFIKFVIHNEMNLYFCKFPAFPLTLFNVKKSKLDTIPVITRTTRFGSLGDFKDYYNLFNKDNYFIINKVFRIKHLNEDLSCGYTDYLIRLIQLKKNEFKLVNIKCELNEI